MGIDGIGRGILTQTSHAREVASKYKLVVFVPLAHADAVRKALAEAGAGQIGEYKNCSFSSRGVGRFTPTDSAKPAIGEVGKPQEVEEERIEVLVPKEIAKAVIEAMLAVHPYEEVAYDVYALVDKGDII